MPAAAKKRRPPRPPRAASAPGTLYNVLHLPPAASRRDVDAALACAVSAHTVLSSSSRRAAYDSAQRAREGAPRGERDGGSGRESEIGGGGGTAVGACGREGREATFSEAVEAAGGRVEGMEKDARRVREGTGRKLWVR